MERKARLGWGVLRILGIVYTILGSVFLVLGLCLLALLSGEEKLVGIVFAPIGGLFFTLGVVFLTIEQGRKRRMDALIEAGRFVWAEVVDCQCNYNVSFHNGIHPYRLIACYRAPNGTKHLFKSENLRFFGTRDLIGKPVRVYGDGDFKHYYVDAAPLLGDYVEH